MKSNTVQGRIALLAAFVLAVSACGGGSAGDPVSASGESEQQDDAELQEQEQEQIPETLAFTDSNGVSEVVVGDSLFVSSSEVLESARADHIRFATQEGASLHAESDCFMGFVNDVYLDLIFCGPAIHLGGSPDAAWDVLSTSTETLEPSSVEQAELGWSGPVNVVSSSANGEFEVGSTLPAGVLMAHPNGVSPGDPLDVPYEQPTMERGAINYRAEPEFSENANVTGRINDGPEPTTEAESRVVVSLLNTEVVDEVVDRALGYSVAAQEGQELLAINLRIDGVDNDAAVALVVDGTRTRFQAWTDGNQTFVLSVDIGAPVVFELQGATGVTQTLDLRTGERTGPDVWYRLSTSSFVGERIPIEYQPKREDGTDSSFWDLQSDAISIDQAMLSFSSDVYGVTASDGQSALLTFSWNSGDLEISSIAIDGDSSILLRLPDGTELPASFGDNELPAYVLAWPYWEVPADFTTGEIEIQLGQQIYRPDNGRYIELVEPSVTTFEVSFPPGSSTE